MDNQATASTVLGSAIVEWLGEEALHESESGALYGELCQRLRGVGMPILRGQVAFRILHPLYDASTLNWNTERGVVVDHFRPEESGQDRFLRSPMGHALTHRLPILRRRLIGETALLDFAVLEEFRALAEDAPDAIARLDLDGRHLFANAMLARTVGLDASEVMGRTHAELAQLIGAPPRVTRLLNGAVQVRRAQRA